jgi:hypothetical protein
MDFGSKEWNEYYHGRNKDGHRPISDQAKRARKAMAQTLTKKGEFEGLKENDDPFQSIWETPFLELDQITKTNIEKDHALTVKVLDRDLSESVITSLLSHGFRWSNRRGGMFWAPRTPLTVAVIERLMEAA